MRVALIERSGHGDSIVSARLISADTDERWEAGEEDQRQNAVSAAAWLAERARASGGRNASIDLLCLDLEGAACSWVVSPSGDARVIEAIARQGVEDEFAGSTSPRHTLGDQVEVPGGATIQAVRAPADNAPRDRLAVLAIPDAPARIVIDELDRLGVQVGGVTSFWHAVALAWDPSAETSRALTREDDSVIEDEAPVGAQVLVDPSGRLVWTWAKRGELIAAGAVRVLSADAGVSVNADDAGRLTGDWLAWSAQLGVSPRRITCVTPELSSQNGSLDGAGLGRVLSRACPNATIDLAVFDDPATETVLRALRRSPEPEQAGDDPARGLVSLSNRPGRAHRGLHIWLSLAILAAAVAAGVGAWRSASSAGEAKARAAELRAEYTQLADGLVDPTPGFELAELLESEVAKERRSLEAGERQASLMPVMEELDAVSFVIGNESVEIREITLEQLRASLVVTVPGLADFEAMRSSLRNIGGSSVRWGEGRTENAGGDRIRVRFSGQWRREP